MKYWKVLTKSAIVALVIGLLFPMAWIAFTGNTTSRTPIIEKEEIQKMTELQRQEWIANNSKEVGFAEHVAGIPSFIARHWAGYLQASIGIFLIVFILNSAYLLGTSGTDHV